MKNIGIYTIVGLMVSFMTSCNDSQSDLLQPKVFFAEETHRLEIGDSSELTYEFQARVSDKVAGKTDITFAFAGMDEVDAYNRKYGTEYELFDMNQVELEQFTATVEEGEVFSNKTALRLSQLDKLVEGKNYLVPLRIVSASLPKIESRDVMYFILSKPVRIMKALNFSNHGIRVSFPAGTQFTSVTYEALVYPNSFGKNSTIMGREGILIFRVGDMDGGVPRNQPQIAGKKEFKSPQLLETKKWYHMAFTYDQPSGKAIMYINGAKVSEATWDTPSFDFGKEVFIGKVIEFMWGERPFSGSMSEVRFWKVARSENQIRENMLTVDPKSEGLAAYYKLNGEDQYEENGVWKIKDASGHQVEGLPVGRHAVSEALGVKQLDAPIEIK